MSKIIHSLIAMAATAMLATACATPAETARRQDAERASIANYMDAAGPELNSFRKLGANLHSWQSLTDDAVLLYTKPQQAFLVRVGGSCPGLEYANAIRVSDNMGTVSRNFDKIYPLDRSPTSQFGCTISSIREVDLQRYKLLQAPFQKARPE